MLKFMTVAALTLTVSLAGFGAASAAPKPSHHQAWLDAIKGGGAIGEIASVGDAFDPNPAQPDPKAACIAAGKVPKTQIEGDGSIGTRCVPAYILEQ